MAALGSVLKKEITDKILEVFPNSFINDKEIRICGVEDGKAIQVKVTLTTAKTNVEHTEGSVTTAAEAAQATPAPTEPSAQEKENISLLLSKLGL